MNDLAFKLIELGRSIASDDELRQKLRGLGQEEFRQAFGFNQHSFTFTEDLAFDDMMSLVRSLAFAEQEHISGFRGSVSLLIPLYLFVAGRPEREHAKIVDWIVRNHPNPYTPFNFRAHRMHWEVAQRESEGPDQTLKLFRELLRSEDRSGRFRGQHHAVTESMNSLRKGKSPCSERIREDIQNRLEREAEDW